MWYFVDKWTVNTNNATVKTSFKLDILLPFSVSGPTNHDSYIPNLYPNVYNDLRAPRFNGFMLRTSGQTDAQRHAILLYARMYRPKWRIYSVM